MERRDGRGEARERREGMEEERRGKGEKERRDGGGETRERRRKGMEEERQGRRRKGMEEERREGMEEERRDGGSAITGSHAAGGTGGYQLLCREGRTAGRQGHQAMEAMWRVASPLLHFTTFTSYRSIPLLFVPLPTTLSPLLPSPHFTSSPHPSSPLFSSLRTSPLHYNLYLHSLPPFPKQPSSSPHFPPLLFNVTFISPPPLHNLHLHFPSFLSSPTFTSLPTSPPFNNLYLLFTTQPSLLHPSTTFTFTSLPSTPFYNLPLHLTEFYLVHFALNSSSLSREL
ncbi:hypothetical protein Pcinc_029226 [Petrolisthes cinctipes]|uniref:Uncharacterized protein n=1 Tax=Petrolisthes cinctipes TaxID=88211 RepID=A0AAE1F1C2_PETCI|nr:hypothetical protein Pcinc_029226 [Petrolisthes cinctipes]